MAQSVAATTGASNPLRIGYIQIEIDQEDIAAVAVFRHSSGVEASVLATKVARRFSLFVDRSPTLDTGVAVVRASTLPVRAKLYDDQGTLVAEGDFPLTGNQAARFVGEVFQSAGTLRGVMTLESEGAFAPLGLRLGNGSLATTALSSPSAARVAYRVHGVNFGPYGQDPRIRPQISEELLRARMEILAMGLKIAVGAWIDTSRSANELELAALIASAQAGNVDLAIIGSETLLRGSVSASELVDQAFCRSPADDCSCRWDLDLRHHYRGQRRAGDAYCRLCCSDWI